MVRKAYSVTAAIRALRQSKIPFTVHVYKYAEKGGARQAAEALSIDVSAVIKTLVFQDEHKNGLLVLMHGNMQVSTGQLARQLRLKKAVPCDQKQATKLTGYKVGGISPFGTRTPLPVFIESSILDIDNIYINGGKRGLLAQLEPSRLSTVLKATPVTVALPF